MKKLQIYITSEFIKFFFGSLLFFVLLVTVADISLRLETYVDNPENMRNFAMYHLLRVPHNIYYIFPIALMFSSTFVLGVLNKNREMLAIENGGISVLKFSAPLLISVIVLCISLVALWEFVAAPANKLMFTINDIIQHNGKKTERSDIHFFGGGGYVYFIDRYVFDEKAMYNATIIKVNENGYIESRVSSPKITWVQGESTWRAENATVFNFENDAISVDYNKDVYDIKTLEEPEYFVNPPILDTMSLSEIRSLIKMRKKANMDVNKFTTDYYFRISYAFSGFVIVMLAVLFSKLSKHSVLVASLVMVVLVSIVYYSILMLFRSLGDIGAMPAYFAAWMPNVLFLFLCFISFKVFY